MKTRYLSLDIFRGATVALMILVNNPGSFAHIYWPLDHAEWNGCTLTDLVFPFFLFAVGNSLAFVLNKHPSHPHQHSFLKKALKRSILIFIIGLFLNWSPFIKWDNDQLVAKAWEKIRILGVLQRIAICYFFASLLMYYFKPKQLIFISAFLLLLYWLLCYACGGLHPYTQADYFGTAIDRFILGEQHMYKMDGVPFDPEGLAGSLSAVVQVIIGYLIGCHILKKGNTYEMLSDLFLTGTLLVLIGLAWDIVFPINKKIWSSSYTVLTSGVATMITACLIYIIEIKKNKQNWIVFFECFGKNPLFIFVLSGFLPRVFGLIRISGSDESGKAIYRSPLGWIYEHIFKHISSDLRLGSLLYALFFISIFWAIGYLLYRKNIFIKV